MGIFAKLGRSALVICLLLGGVIVLFEEKLIYFPGKQPEGRFEPADYPVGESRFGTRIEDCWFAADDGVQLHGWFCSPDRKQGEELAPVAAKPVLLWFHGNAGNIADRYDMIRMLMAIPVRVFIVDYRGYGRSDGRPSEKGLYADARGAWKYLVRQREIPPSRIVLFGKSLGGAVAVDLATHVTPAGLIVQSSFTSVPDMAANLIPFFPRFLLRTKMDSLHKIPKVSCPKLFVHSPADEIVPYRLGRRLFEAASEPKRFLDVPGAPHNETYLVGGEAYLDGLRSFIQGCASAG